MQEEQTASSGDFKGKQNQKHLMNAEETSFPNTTENPHVYKKFIWDFFPLNREPRSSGVMNSTIGTEKKPWNRV